MKLLLNIMNKLIIPFLLFSVLVYGQKVTKQEQKVLKVVEKNNDDAVQFLEKIVNINSGSMNHEGVKKVGDELRIEFDKLGFKTEWVDQSAVNRAGHLFAETAGNSGKKLLLIGHLDTVFPKNEAFQKWEERDGKTYGPGANDMKGGDVIILYALKALSEAGLLNNAQIIVAYTGDEEMAGSPISISRNDLINAAKRSDIALGFETATGLNYATVARRGSSGWQVESKGVRAHSSGIFSERTGAGAIFEMSRILNSFYEEVRGEEYLTFNPGMIAGGTEIKYDTVNSAASLFGKSNVVAQTAITSGGLRFISQEQLENTRAKMSEIVANSLPQTSSSITFIDKYPPMSPTEGNMELLKVLNQVSIDMGLGEVKAWDPGKRGAADISFVAEYVDCLSGLGSMGSGAHTPNESIDLSTFEDLTKRTALLIYRLINTK